MKHLFTLFTCFFLMNGYGSIIYRPINYSVNTNNLSYNLDVNGDGTKDYVIQLSYDNGSGNFVCRITGQTVGSNTNIADDTPENPGDPVGSNASWSSNPVFFESNGAAYDGGLFTGGEHYMGLQFNLNNNQYRAWLRVEISNYNTCLIKDLAYDNNSANTINVAQGLPTDIKTIAPENIYVNWSNNNLNVIANNTDLTNAKLTVYDITGKELLTHTLQSSSEEMPFERPASGIYITCVRFNNGQIIARKLLMQ